MTKKKIEYGSKESILEALETLRNATNSAYDYIFFKGDNSDYKEILYSLEQIEFWSGSTIKQLFKFLKKILEDEKLIKEICNTP